MRANTRRQLREWRWIIWFLFIAWWWYPVVFVLWLLAEAVRGLIWVVKEVNDKYGH